MNINLTANGKAITRQVKTMEQARIDYIRRSILYSANVGVATAMGTGIGCGFKNLSELVPAALLTIGTAAHRWLNAPKFKISKADKTKYNEIVERAINIKKARKERLKKEEIEKMERHVKIEQLLGFLA